VIWNCGRLSSHAPVAWLIVDSDVAY
jgi:hypothetical protein